MRTLRWSFLQPRRALAILAAVATAFAPTALTSPYPPRSSPTLAKAGRSFFSHQKNGPGSMMPMPLVAPLFIQDRDFASTLVIINGSAETAVADVTLSDLDGREISRKTVSLSGHSQLRLEVFQLLQTAISRATMGRITVTQNLAPKGSSILASLSITYLGSHQPNYIDEELAMPTTEGSQILRAVADKSSGSPLIAITSLSDMPQRVTIECLGESAARLFSKSVQLLGGETLMTGACSPKTVYGGDLETASTDDGETPSEPHAVGIALTTDGMPGSFAAFGLARHRKDGDQYFSALTFADPKMIRSSNTVFTGVPVGSATPLPGGRYVPQLALVNFSTKDIHVLIKYAQSSSSTPVVQVLQNLLVPARSSTSFDVNGPDGDAALRNSFLVIPDSAPGELMAKLVSVSESSLREVELIGKDEMSKENGGSHPWSLEKSTESTLLLFNPSAEEQPFTVAIQAGDVLWQKVYKLAPMQTEALPIRGLIQERVKDDKGVVLPRNALVGEVGWFTPGPGRGKGRILQSNRDLAMARDFSCGNGNVLCGASFSGNTTTFPLNATVTFGTLSAEVCFDSTPGSGCTGTFSYWGTSNYTWQWSISDSSIISFPGASNTATVSVYGHGNGSTSVSAYVYDPVGFCGPYPGGATGTVTHCPTSVSIAGTTPIPLENVFPTDKTGVGIVASMQVGPSSSVSYNQTQISESLSVNGVMQNTCTNIRECNGGPPFTVGTGGSAYGVTFNSANNIFYDQHTLVSAPSILDAAGLNQCTYSCNQTYSAVSDPKGYACGGTNLGSYIVTYTFTKDTINGTPVTRTSVSKQ